MYNIYYHYPIGPIHKTCIHDTMHFFRNIHISRTLFLFAVLPWTGLAGCTWENPLDAWATGAATPAAASMVVPWRNGAAKHGGGEGGGIVDSTVPTKTVLKNTCNSRNLTYVGKKV